MSELAKLIIISGIMLTVAGVLFLALSHITGMPKLPGDIFIKRGNFTFYFPIVSSLIVSIIITIILNLFFRK